MRYYGIRNLSNSGEPAGSGNDCRLRVTPQDEKDMTIKMRDVKMKLLKNPEVRAEYERMEPEFALIRWMDPIKLVK
jgi:hypothetical protein